MEEMGSGGLVEQILKEIKDSKQKFTDEQNQYSVTEEVEHLSEVQEEASAYECLDQSQGYFTSQGNFSSKAENSLNMNIGPNVQDIKLNLESDGGSHWNHP